MDEKSKKHHLKVLNLSLKIAETMRDEYHGEGLPIAEAFPALWETLDSMVEVALETHQSPQKLAKSMEQSYLNLMRKFKKYN